MGSLIVTDVPYYSKILMLEENWVRGIWELYHFLNFVVNLKLFWKNKVYFKKIMYVKYLHMIRTWKIVVSTMNTDNLVSKRILYAVKYDLVLPLALWRYNWHITLSKFKAYSVMIWQYDLFSPIQPLFFIGSFFFSIHVTLFPFSTSFFLAFSSASIFILLPTHV